MISPIFELNHFTGGVRGEHLLPRSPVVFPMLSTFLSSTVLGYYLDHSRWKPMMFSGGSAMSFSTLTLFQRNKPTRGTSWGKHVSKLMAKRDSSRWEGHEGEILKLR
jgi:hypothetical protein